MSTAGAQSSNATQKSSVEALAQLKKENSFQKALRDTGYLLKHHAIPGKIVFISYAWYDESNEEGKAENLKLQEWLKKLAQDLKTVGVRVHLDIEGIKGKLSDWMKTGIAESHHVILVGTPRYKERASQETAVGFEFQHIMEKLQKPNGPSNILLPILYAGDFGSAFPAEVTQYLIRDFREAEQYYQLMLGLVKPLGMVPDLYPDLEQAGSYYQEYAWLYESFEKQLALLKAEIQTLKEGHGLTVIRNELPSASPYFVGREAEMQALEEHFSVSGLQIVSIQGMGGTGKSQLAVEYAYQSPLKGGYRLIRWLKADSVENFKNAYFALGEDLGLARKDYKDAEARLLKDINHQLLRYQRTLLICDNVESLEELRPYFPSAGEGGTIHILVTTRHALVDTLMVKVGEFSAEEVQGYLKKRLQKEVPLHQAQRLGLELGYLPLAVVQSAGYMVKYAKPLEPFLGMLTGAQRQKVLDNDVNLKAVSTLWDITLEKLTPSALMLLRLCSLLEPDNIPRGLLEQFPLEGDADEILFELRSQSLLMEAGKEGELFRIHRLLQEAIQRQLPKESPILRELLEKGIDVLQQLIGDQHEESDANQYVFWKARDYLWVQIRHLVRVGQEYRIGEGLIAQLLEWQGDYQRIILLQANESAHSYEASLNLRRSVYGEQDIRVGECLERLGEVEEFKSHYNEALGYFQQALALYQAKTDQRRIATAQHLIGRIYREQDKYDEALTHYQQALVIRKATHGDNHPTVATSLGCIGSVYEIQGKYGEALTYYQQALVIRKATHGDNHPTVATSLGWIGLVYNAQGKYAEALTHYQQALVIQKATYGQHHPEVAVSLICIGNVFERQGQYHDALTYYQQAFKIFKATYGDNHPHVAALLLCIGNVYKVQGKYPEALTYFQQALVIQKATHGEYHREVAASLGCIGNVFVRQGKYAESLTHFQQAFSIYKAAYGEHHPSLADLLYVIGFIFYEQGKYEETFKCFEQALSIRRATFKDDNHPDVKKSLESVELSRKKLPKKSQLATFMTPSFSTGSSSSNVTNPLIFSDRTRRINTQGVQLSEEDRKRKDCCVM